MPHAVHEIPLPPPEKPERERGRSPELERATIGVGAASMWIADVQRGARELAQRCGAVALTIELDDGRRLEVRDLRSGPGDGFVTFLLADERELGVRLDRLVGVELAPAAQNERAFRVRRRDVGFGAE